MRCTSPKYLYFSLDANGSPVGGAKRPDGSGDYVAMPCGGCTPCILNHARDLANAIYLECKFSDYCCTGTISFDDEHLPDSFEEARRIIRNEVKPKMRRAGFNPRSYWFIERGENTGRIHCHPVFFCEDFREPGAVETIGGTKYHSRTFKKFWPYGDVYQLDAVTPESAAYAAGHQAGKPLIPRFSEDGVQNWERIPATRPSIGMSFARKYYRDMNVVGALVRGKGMTAIPKKFLRNLPDDLAPAIEARRKFAAECTDKVESIEQLEKREHMTNVMLEQGYAAKVWASGSRRRR